MAAQRPLNICNVLTTPVGLWTALVHANSCSSQSFLDLMTCTFSQPYRKVWHKTEGKRMLYKCRDILKRKGKKGEQERGKKSPFRITHCKNGAPYVSEELAAFQAFNFYFGFFLQRIFIALSFTCKNIQWYFKRISVSSVSLLISTLQSVLPQSSGSYFFSEMANENFCHTEMDLSDGGKQSIVLTSQMHLSVF